MTEPLSAKFSSELAEEDKKTVTEELHRFQEMREAVRKESLKAQKALPRDKHLKHDIQSLQDDLRGAHERDQGALLSDLLLSQTLMSRNTSVALPDMRFPYFARVRVRVGGGASGRVRDLLLGETSFIQGSIVILDARVSPYFSVWLQESVGEEYFFEDESKHGGARVLTGTVLERLKVRWSGQGEPVAFIDDKSEIYLCESSNLWKKKDLNSRFLPSERRAARNLVNPLDLVKMEQYLDREQLKVLLEDHNDHLLITGGAGSGKTTVALMRLARYLSESQDSKKQSDVLVVVPEPGLRRWCQKMLASLGLTDVPVATLDDWIFAEASRVLPSLNMKLSMDTPSVVVSLKRDPAMLILAEKLESVKIVRLQKLFKHEFSFLDQMGSLLAFNPAEPKCLKDRVKDQLRYVRRKVTVSDATWDKRLELFESKIWAEFFDFHFELARLYLSESLLREVVASSEGRLSNRHVDETIKFSRRQFVVKAADLSLDHDEDFAIGVDSFAETEFEEGVRGSLDVEDIGLCLLLLHRYTGTLNSPYGAMRNFWHILVDEAQALSAVEAKVLGLMLRSNQNESGRLTLSGDLLQDFRKLDHGSSGDVSLTVEKLNDNRWSELEQHVALGAFKRRTLNAVYRSPPEIVEWCSTTVLGAGQKIGVSVKSNADIAAGDGKALTLEGLGCMSEIQAEVFFELSQLMVKAPHSSCVVLCTDEEGAVGFYQNIEKVWPEVRIVRDGDFDFLPGVDFTDVDSVKGLEFDYVVIADAGVFQYPESFESRKKLYVAATRAVKQLWVIGPQMRLTKIALSR